METKNLNKTMTKDAIIVKIAGYVSDLLQIDSRNKDSDYINDRLDKLNNLNESLEQLGFERVNLNNMRDHLLE